MTLFVRSVCIKGTSDQIFRLRINALEIDDLAVFRPQDTQIVPP